MFTDLQQKEIDAGRQAGLDTSLYARDDFDSLKMRSIRRGLEKNVDIKRFPLKDFNSRQIDEIVLGLESGVEVGLYADSMYDADQMYQIRRGMEAGVDVSVYANPSFDHRQMAELRWSLKQGADISSYAKAYVSADRMAYERRAAAGENIVSSGPVEAVKMWYGNPRVIERKYDVYVSGGNDIDQSKFLRWNAKVDRQMSERVSASLRSKGVTMAIPAETSGYALYNTICKSVGGDDRAAVVLNDAGITGFSYSGDGGKPRYVVFGGADVLDGLQAVADKRTLRSEAERNAIIDKIREIHSYSEGNIEVIVVRDGMPLPKVVEQSIDDCCGIGYNGALYVNVDNIGSKEEAVNLWIREVGAKEGLKTLIPDDIVRSEFLGSVWDTAIRLSANVDNKEVCRIVSEVKQRYNEREGSLEDDMWRCPDYAKSRLGEMFFGDFANSVDVKRELTHQEKSFWKDISEKVKNIIGQAFGIKGDKVLNQKDLAKVCACAVKAGESQKSKIRMVIRDKINFRRKESERAGIEAAKRGMKI